MIQHECGESCAMTQLVFVVLVSTTTNNAVQEG